MLDTRLELNEILTRRCDSDGKEARFHRIHIEPEIPQTICNMLSVLKCKALQAVRMCAHNNVCPHTRFAGQKNNLYNGKG